MKRLISGFIAMAIVGSALGLKPFNASNIYCVANGTPKPDQSCTAFSQPPCVKIDYEIDLSGTNEINPCAKKNLGTAFDGSNPNKCLRIYSFRLLQPGQ